MASPMPSTDMDNALACCICFDSYIDPCIPKNLDCGHVCCKECLQQILLGSKKKGFVQCPECRRQTKVPGGKIANLPTNFPLKSLAEAEHRRKQSAPTARRTTLLRRVETLRDEAQRPQQSQINPDDDDSSLQMKIQCLEQQLEQKQQPSNKQDGAYLSLDDSDMDNPVYMELAEDRKPSPPMSPSERPLPSIPKSERPPRMSLPTGSKLPQEGASPLSSPTEPTKVSRNLPSRHSLPEISSSCMESQQATVQPHRRQLESVEKFGNFEQAQGIALTPDGAVVICDFMKQTVSVFHKKRGKYDKKFDLKLNSKNSNKPADVAVTTKGKFLVPRRTATELYSPKGKYERSLKNFIEDTLGVCTVATAQDGRILVGDISYFNIIIYDPDGNAILQTLHSDTKPARIAALQGTLIAVSHARLGRLEIVDSSLNQSIQLIEIPEALGMCYYPNTNSVLVVRNERLNPGSVQRNTGVIEQYDIRTGALKVVLAEGLFHPFNLAFTASGMLAVADKWTIKVFRVLENSIYE